MTRRAALAHAILVTPALAVLPLRAAPADASARLTEIERGYGGRLGVSVLDTGSGKHLAHRDNERFALLSTFKFLASALVLARVDRGQEQLDRRVTYAKSDLVEYSPATEKHAGAEGMTIAEICEAAMVLSDNTAGNLLLASFGGPAGLTAFARSLGDDVTRLDRIEPHLNEAKPGDLRDTTTPAAMLGVMRKLIVGDALSASSRDYLARWLVGNKTGDKRIRAGLPAGWRVGDKTGTGSNATANDIAVVWPPGRAPILIASYYAESQASAEQRNAVHADVGRIVAESF